MERAGGGGGRGMMSCQVAAGSGSRPAVRGLLLSLGLAAGKDKVCVCSNGVRMMNCTLRNLACVRLIFIWMSDYGVFLFHTAAARNL